MSHTDPARNPVFIQIIPQSLNNILLTPYIIFKYGYICCRPLRRGKIRRENSASRVRNLRQPIGSFSLSGQKDNVRVFGYVHHDTASRKTKVCLGWGTPNAGVHQGKEGHRENATGGLSVVRVFPSSSSTISIANSTRYGKYFLHSYPTAQR